ncbi:MAG TPA: hypothetical protein VGA77_16480 [Propylenella sp.]
MMWRRNGRRRYSARVVFAVAGLAASVAAAEPPDPSVLFGACFSRTHSAVDLAARPGQRVATISMQFQGFEGALLASVVYKLRYGTKFGFGADCHREIAGGFSCEACAGGACDANAEVFEIHWSGGDALRIVNQKTGMLAENPEGGRDYLISRGEHRAYFLMRARPEDCAW